MYPLWICNECAKSLGYPHKYNFAIYHQDTCGWCSTKKLVTEPIDFGCPPYNKKIHNK